MQKTADQFKLTPPFCPNSLCRFHLGTIEKFYVKNGWAKTDKPPFRNQRYRCKECLTQFSHNTFLLEFRCRLTNLSKDILHYSMNGMSNNAIARLLHISEGTVRDRLRIMASQSLIFEKENYPKEIKENVAYDGFETFTHSQFSPCYVNTAVGSNSMFIYHNTFSPLNRKGRMTDEQKIKNQSLLQKHGPYPRDSVYQESLYILQSISKRSNRIILFSDEHKAYARAMKSFPTTLTHKTISSKAKRTPSNPLFPINHLHLLYRHCFSGQQRETISFQKNEAALMDKIQLMKIYRNFMSTKFVKKNQFDEKANKWSPAMYVGVSDRVLNFEDIYNFRRLRTQIYLDEREECFWKRIYPYSRQKISMKK
jgi:transposase-like protein